MVCWLSFVVRCLLSVVVCVADWRLLRVAVCGLLFAMGQLVFVVCCCLVGVGDNCLLFADCWLAMVVAC